MIMGGLYPCCVHCYAFAKFITPSTGMTPRASQPASEGTEPVFASSPNGNPPGVSHELATRSADWNELRRSTERLALAVRAGGVGTLDYDVVNNRLEWDEQMFRLYGIASEQFGGAYEAWQAGLHPEDKQRGDAEIQLALQAKKEFDIQFRVLWPDGTIRHIRGFASVERDATGQPLRMIGTNWDITAQKHAEEALRESEANFRTFFETLSDVVVVASPEGRILFANSAASDILGYTPDELRGMSVLDMHPSSMHPEAEAIFGAMLRGERESCPLPLARKDGGFVPVDTRVWFGKWDGTDCIFGVSKNLSGEQEAKQRFERLFRSNPGMIALSSLPDHRFVDVNDAFLETLGYTRDEVLGKISTELDLFVDPQRHVAAAEQLKTHGRLADYEMQIRCKDGLILDGIFSGEVIQSQGDRFLQSVMVNITARKRAEAELGRLSVIQRELIRLATDFINVPTERQDAAIEESLATMGRLIEADRAYLFSYDFAAGILRNTHEWCSPGITPEIANLQAVPTALLPDWVAAHRVGEAVHIPSVAALPAEGVLRQSLESQEVLSLITLPLMQADACLGFVGFDAVRQERVWRQDEVALLRVLAGLYANFEARRAAERQASLLQENLVQARDAAQAGAQAKSLFLANMSHEIRTPLNAILGNAQIMESECRHCPTGRRLSAITRSGDHLLELLTDLLELVRNDAGTVTLVPMNFDFYQVFEDVLLIFARHPDADGLIFEPSIAADVPQFIFADQGKLRQILVNLVGNAVKFTSSGHVRMSAAVVPGGGADEVMVVVDVEDTGCGIAATEVERIFDVFEQVQQGRKLGKGAGLGLPLSRRYARALGGDVTVSSRLGEGSCFRLSFRAGVASAEAGEQLRRGSVCCLAPDTPPCRLLVVDDELDNRSMLVGMLSAVGFEVEAVATAALALHRLGLAPRFDVVLMDKRLPEMDGYEAIRLLRELPGGRDLAVLVVTASGQAEEKQLALAAGADGYVAKPLHREQLLAEIGRVARVKYAYEVPTVTQSLAPLDAADLSILDAQARRLLLEALRRGDIRQLRQLLGTLGPEHAGLAAQMSVLVNAYAYERLSSLLDAVK